jgi:outer membrane immunogenic protein
VIAGATVWGQQTHPLKPSVDLAVVYQPLLANRVVNGSFWLQGGGLQLHSQFWHGLGVVADVSGAHARDTHDSGVGLDLVTITFGPRYTWTSPYRRTALFGQILVGEADGLNSVFPGAFGVSSSAHGLALLVGGGINVPLQRRLTVRAAEVSWVRTQLPNATTNVQNNLRLGAGLIYRF